MPLHLPGILVIVAALRMAGTVVGLPGGSANTARNFLFVLVVALLPASSTNRPASQGERLRRGAQVHDGH